MIGENESLIRAVGLGYDCSVRVRVVVLGTELRLGWFLAENSQV